MKAILVIDLPDTTNLSLCTVDYGVWEDISTNGDENLIAESSYGRLKPMPKEQTLAGAISWTNYAEGWNAFRKEILGENDEQSNISD